MILNYKSAKDIKSYLYLSKAKVDWLYQQIQEPEEKTTIRWKINLNFLSREIQKEHESKINEQDKLDAVVAALEERRMIGPPEDRHKDYIKGVFSMKWGLFDDHSFRSDTEGPLVYFSCLVGKLLIGLGGSSIHVGNPYGIGATSSRSSTPVLCAWLRAGSDTGSRPPSHYRESVDSELYEISDAMAWANHYLRGPHQDVEFVARVLNRGRGVLDPWQREERGEVILGTPLYVSQVNSVYVETNR